MQAGRGIILPPWGHRRSLHCRQPPWRAPWLPHQARSPRGRRTQIRNRTWLPGGSRSARCCCRLQHTPPAVSTRILISSANTLECASPVLALPCSQRQQDMRDTNQHNHLSFSMPPLFQSCRSIRGCLLPALLETLYSKTAVQQRPYWWRIIPLTLRPSSLPLFSMMVSASAMIWQGWL